MPKIFRNIRKKLLAANKVTGYLKYALGEILLVVIGILIALQVNNWKENIQNHKLEVATLENIRSDLVLQRGIIDGQLQFEENIIEKADSAALYLSSPFPLRKLYALLFDLTERRTFTENKTSFINMDNTLDKKLIQNNELQNDIVRYYQQLDYVTQVVNNNNLFLVDNNFGSFLYTNSLNIRLNENGNIDTRQKISPEKRMELKTQLSLRKIVSEYIRKHCMAQQKATTNLIHLIDKELNK